MQHETVARRYASALFALALESGKMSAVGQGLDAAVASLKANPDAQRFFVSPVIDRGLKAAAIAKTFGGRIDELALNTILLLIRKRREALLAAIAHEYAKLALAQAKLEPLEIVSARALTQAQATDIVARLSRVYGKQFEVTQRVDPVLLGGVRVTMGDRRIDGTIAGRVDELARELLDSGPQVGLV